MSSHYKQLEEKQPFSIKQIPVKLERQSQRVLSTTYHTMVHSKFLCPGALGLKVAHKNGSCYKYQLSITYPHSDLRTDHKRELILLLIWITVVLLSFLASLGPRFTVQIKS